MLENKNLIKMKNSVLMHIASSSKLCNAGFE